MIYYILEGKWSNSIAETSGTELHIFQAYSDEHATEKAQSYANALRFKISKLLKVTAVERVEVE
ncbi:MAG: hypothetical protein HYX21_01485 [Candidatus Yanofskybacteria bacterium]|nr:hypothetical protein [Candidatus Yanofskybacteria bacterium]MBI4079554.1 hypothetical protein [Candidatus Levybacteria bacterium]